tara:strand:+ start:7990 stop:10023 length:2034 start_codon:yes stop_codon:yes gene_type:complete
MLNPYFLNNAKSEQNLIQSLVNEQLKMYGIEIYYIPRRYITKNTVIKEVIQSEFDNAYPLEAYLDSYDGYGGQGTLLSKFGIQEQDDLKLIVSRDRYERYITPLIKNIPNIELSSRPKEGDLVYFPLGDRLFEINYVEHEQPFYQLQKNYVYTLSLQLYRYEDEVIDTGVETIDDEIEQIGYIQTLTLIGQAITAAGTATTSTGGITLPTITNIGGGYASAPVVGFSSAPSGGVTAVGIASISNDFIGCDGTKGGTVQAILLSNAGAGYTVAPTITFTGGGGGGAAATTGIGSFDVVASITLTNAGSGYTTNPIITIERPDRVATATATVGASGTITALTITDGGDGYVATPSLTISTPNRSGSISSFKLNSAGIKTDNVYSQIPGHSSLNSSGVGGFAGSHGVDYVVGDIVTFVKPSGVGTAGTEARIRIDSVTVDGSVIGFTQIYGGYDYEISEGSSAGLYTAENVSGSMNGDGLRLRIELIESVVGTTATGIASISPAGDVTSLTVTNPGGGYTKSPHPNAPTVTISNDNAFKDPAKIQATGVGIINSGGVVTNAFVINPGSGYTTTPTVSFSAPPTSAATGSYVFNEIVTGSVSGTTARVKQWDAVNNSLEVSVVDGAFLRGETIVGQESGASFAIRLVDKDDKVDPFADNDTIETKADDIIDFSKTNPFGMP